MTRLRDLVEAIEAENSGHSERKSKLYEAVKRAGFDKSAVSEVVRIRAKRAVDPAAFAAMGNLVNSYLEQCGDPPTQARDAGAGARVATAVPSDRPLTIKERAEALAARAAARARGEPVDDEIPGFLRRQA